MSSINACHFIGRLTRDPELRFIPNGGKAAEVIANHCKKGKLFAMSGKLQPQHWEDNNGQKRSKMKLFISGFKILEWANSNQGQQQNSYQQSSQPYQQQQPQQQYQQQGPAGTQGPGPQQDFNGFQAIDGDDEIPF